MLLFFLACGDVEPDSLDCEHADEVEWNYWADGFFSTYCNGCHSSMTTNRYNAPESINFDVEQEVLSQAELIYTSVLINQNMPKGGGVEETELQFLKTYLTCWGGVEP